METQEVVTTTPEDDVTLSTVNLADNTYMSAATVPAATEDADAFTGSLTNIQSTATEPANVVALRQAFAAALANKNFLSEGKRIEKAIAALTMPNPEERVRAQLQVHTEKTLYAKAAKDAERGLPFVLPTKAEIDAKVEEGLNLWRSKQN